MLYENLYSKVIFFLRKDKNEKQIAQDLTIVFCLCENSAKNIPWRGVKNMLSFHPSLNIEYYFYLET